MSKQRTDVSGWANLRPGDTIVETVNTYSNGTWTVEREVPEIAPGTAGTATVRGVEGVRVMRLDGTDHPWSSATFFAPAGDVKGPGQNRHDDWQVTDFVPDAPSACADDGVSMCPKMAYSNKQIGRELDEARAEVERLRGQLADRSNDARRYLEESRDYKKSAELNKGAAESAQGHIDMLQERIDAVLNLADQWKAAQKENAAALERHELLPCKTPDAADFRYAATGCLDVPPVDAPEPRPAFVLPDLYALTTAIADDSPLHLPVERREQFKAAAERVRALLAEHAVTEDSLTTALMPTYFDQEHSARTVARVTLARLTGEARS